MSRGGETPSQTRHIGFKWQGTGPYYCIGDLNDTEGKLQVIVDDATQYWLILDTGEIHQASTVQWNDGVANAIKSTLQGLGLTINEVTYKQENLVPGDTWPQRGGLEILN